MIRPLRYHLQCYSGCMDTLGSRLPRNACACAVDRVGCLYALELACCVEHRWMTDRCSSVLVLNRAGMGSATSIDIGRNRVYNEHHYRQEWVYNEHHYKQVWDL